MVKVWDMDTGTEVRTAVQRQKGITDNFVKIELSPLPCPE